MCSFNLTQEHSKIQNRFSGEVIKEDRFEKIESIAGVDISFEKNKIAAAASERRIFWPQRL